MGTETSSWVLLLCPPRNCFSNLISNSLPMLPLHCLFPMSPHEFASFLLAFSSLLGSPFNTRHKQPNTGFQLISIRAMCVSTLAWLWVLLDLSLAKWRGGGGKREPLLAFARDVNSKLLEAAAFWPKGREVVFWHAPSRKAVAGSSYVASFLACLACVFSVYHIFFITFHLAQSLQLQPFKFLV